MGLIVECRIERLGVCPLEFTVHHIVSTESSIPANRSVHNVPPDDTLTVAAEDFLLPALALELELGRAPEALLDELPAIVVCPEISEKMGIW